MKKWCWVLQKVMVSTPFRNSKLKKFSTICLGLPVSEEQLKEAAEQSGVLNVSEGFLDPAFRLECKRLIPNIQDIEAKDCREAYLYLKENCNLSS